MITHNFSIIQENVGREDNREQHKREKVDYQQLLHDDSEDKVLMFLMTRYTRLCIRFSNTKDTVCSKNVDDIFEKTY